MDRQYDPTINGAADDRCDLSRHQDSMSPQVDSSERALQTTALQPPILPDIEEHRNIELFNATQVAYPENQLVHQVFETQVDRTPNAMAVACEEESLTYAALNRRANQLARFLR